jgi:transposase
MLGTEDFMVIQALVKRGVYVCDIARQLGVHPKTVSRALARGSAPTPTRTRRTSRLDAYRAQVDQLLAEGVWNAVVILREIQARGYIGKGSILRDYIRPKRALRPSRATVRFETVPGRQLQSDWGHDRKSGKGHRKLPGWISQHRHRRLRLDVGR